MGQGANRAYVDGIVHCVDHLKVDHWSPVWFDDLSFMLHYPKNPSLKVYWLLPGKTVADGLRLIISDEDTLVMTSVVEKFRHFVIYFDHDDKLAGLNRTYVQQNKSEKLPAFYSNLKTSEGNVATSDEDNDSEGDSDIVDSDYELGLDDDLLEEPLVDQQVGKGRQMVGNKDDDVSTDDDGLQLPASDDEGDVRMGFKSFREEDMGNPQFKVGMMFDSAPILRKAITEYSLKHRVAIKIPKNEPKRVRAKCDTDCPWLLYASWDKRGHGLLVKTYNGVHTCQKKWELQRCTSNWLAEKYIDSFRADQKMSLTNFARVVQKEWNLTPSRSKLARARRLAMKKVLGDEEEQYNMLWDYANEVRRSNPGSTLYVNLAGSLFSSMYVSFDACKRGFLAGCRPLIYLDGCHLKTKCGGIMLTAVGIDPNDCIYPIAFGVVEVESLATWTWFLETLKEDLGIQNTYPWTVMTDKQKVSLSNNPISVVHLHFLTHSHGLISLTWFAGVNSSSVKGVCRI